MKYLYQNVKKGVKETIKGLSHGDKIPTERDLADIYQVDRITVRRALKDLEKEGILIKRRGAGSFVNDKNVDGENKISLMMPTFNTSEHNDIYKGIRKYIANKDYAIELLDCSLSKKQEYAYLDYLEKSKVNKIIIYPFFKDAITKAFATRLNHIVSKGKKIVVIDQFVSGADCEFVLFDKYKSAYRLFEYLIGKGHRSILLINTCNDNTGMVIKKAYEQIKYDYNIVDNPNLYVEINIKKSSEPTKELLKTINKKNIYYTSVVCSNNSFAKVCIDFFKENNLSDKEIVSIYHKTQTFIPPKPYVFEDCEKLGYKAVEILLDFEEKTEEKINPKIHYIDTKFVN